MNGLTLETKSLEITNLEIYAFCFPPGLSYELNLLMRSITSHAGENMGYAAAYFIPEKQRIIAK